MLFPIKRLLQAHRSEHQGLTDGCANYPYPSTMALMFYMLEVDIAATSCQKDSLPGNRMEENLIADLV